MQAAEMRPMTLGEILDRTFSLYRNHFVLFIGIAALPNLVVLLMNLIVQGINAALVSTTSSGGGDSGTVDIATGPSTTPVLLGVIAAAGFSILLLVVYWVALVFSQAATVFAVSDVHLGRATSIGQSYARVKGHFWQMVGVMISVGLRVILGFLLLILPGIYLMLKYALAVPAAVLEDVNSSTALDRSSTLTEGTMGRIFLVFVLVWVLSLVAAGIFQGPILVAMVATGGWGSEPPVWLQTFSHLAEFLSNSLVGPVITIALALLYYDERVRKEAFDLQMMMQSLDGAPASGAPTIPSGGGIGTPRQFS